MFILRGNNRKKIIKSNALPDKGVTLVELIVSIAILGLLIVPLFHNLLVSARINAETGKVQQQTILAQNLMEQMKLLPMEEIAKEFNYPSLIGGSTKAEVKPKAGGGYEEVSILERSSIRTLAPGLAAGYEYQLVERTDRPYYFAETEIEYGGRKYDAIYTIDGTAYRVDAGGALTGYNTYKMPLLKEVNSSNNVVALQTYETEMAVATLYNNHVSYCIKQEEEHALDPTFHMEYHSMEEIEATLKKQIRIEISQSGSEVVVKIDLLYSSGYDNGIGYVGCGTVSNELITKALPYPNGSIYVFYYPSYWDEIVIQKDETITEVVDVYLYRQDNPDGTNPNDKNDLTLLPSPIAVNFFSNVVELTASRIKLEDAKNRIFDVKVQLFEAGTGFRPEALCAELTSTKEE